MIKNKQFFFTAIIALIVSLVAQNASADILCQRKNQDPTAHYSTRVQAIVSLSTGSTCKKGYRKVAVIPSTSDIEAISLKVFQANAQSLTGPQGPVGPTGPQGPQGPQGTSGASTSTVACSDVAPSNGQPTGWAGCGLQGRVSELFCVVSGAPGSTTGTWTKANYVDGIASNEYDTTRDRIRCSKLSTTGSVKACARCLGDTIPDIEEPGTVSFVTAGTYTWQVPSTAKNFTVEVVGAGGSGGGSDSRNTDGGAGGGGGYAVKYFAQPVKGATYTIIVGDGGAAKKAGGNSSFQGTGAAIVANGGGAGVTTSTGAGRKGGAGGTASGGDTVIAGHVGEDFVNFPQGDGGVSGLVLSNLNVHCRPYKNQSRCLQGYQDNNPGDNFGNASGADMPAGSAVTASTKGDSAGGQGYSPGNGGAPSRGGLTPGKGGVGMVKITVGY